MSITYTLEERQQFQINRLKKEVKRLKLIIKKSKEPRISKFTLKDRVDYADIRIAVLRNDVDELMGEKKFEKICKHRLLDHNRVCKSCGEVIELDEKNRPIKRG